MTNPSPRYAGALEHATGKPISSLGFGGGVDLPGQAGPSDRPSEPLGNTATAPDAGSLSGIWVSRYVYPSSGRGGNFEGRHHVILVHSGSHIHAESLTNSSDSKLTLSLEVRGPVITGTWTEQTDPDGYYGGAVYHGAIQLLLAPTGHRMVGKWVGFGKDFDVNTGPWTLQLVSRDTRKSATSSYDRPPEPGPDFREETIE